MENSNENSRLVVSNFSDNSNIIKNLKEKIGLREKSKKVNVTSAGSFKKKKIIIKIREK